MRVLVVGNGARSHCVAYALSKCGADISVFTEIRSPWLAIMAGQDHVKIGESHDPEKVVEFAKREQPDLVFVGPEEPLAVGVVDAILDVLGIPCVGPRKALAQIESSKSFTRNLLRRHAIPGNVEYRVFEDDVGLEGYLERLGEFVVKPDGLTGGKGVKVSGDHLANIQEGVAYARQLLTTGVKVVVEERLEGEEFSLHSFYDGKTIRHAIPVQDHKRAECGDRGPNTGGMGSYSCADHSLPFLEERDLAAAWEVNVAVAEALTEEFDELYRGVLYGGFMATADGVRLLEYNARLGDPEAMNLIPLLETNFLDLCVAISNGTLDSVQVEFRKQASVCKYLVPEGYPTNPKRDVEIDCCAASQDGESAQLYYAAVAEIDEKVMLTGSRAVAFVAFADTVDKASQLAEDALTQVKGPLSHRSDIGTSSLLDRRVAHMKRLRNII